MTDLMDMADEIGPISESHHFSCERGNKHLTQRLLVEALRQAEQKIRGEYPDVPPPRGLEQQPEPLLEAEIRELFPSALGVAASTTSNTPANPRASQVTHATPKLTHRNTPGGNQNDSPTSTSSKRHGASPSASSSSSPQLPQPKRRPEPDDEPAESSTSSVPPIRRVRASTTNASDDSGPTHNTRATNKRKPSSLAIRGGSSRKR